MAIRVGVLRGGPSNEYEVSLKTGENILANLPEKYAGRDIVLTKKGEWIFERRFSHPEKIFRRIDVIFNALHGYFGEDGKVQRLLEQFNIPYTGSGVLASSLGMNKILSRRLFLRAGLNIPRTIIIDFEETGRLDLDFKIFKLMHPPWVIKPINGGSSVGVFIVKEFKDLAGALEAQAGPQIIVEEYIRGREATCGVIDDFRGQKHYSLPVIEIIPPAEHEFFNYRAKYSGESREICPGNFNKETKDKIEEAAAIAHRVLGCRHYSRQDFRISERAGERGKIYLLEANTLPGLTRESLVPKAAEAVGFSYPGFLDHVLTLALSR